MKCPSFSTQSSSVSFRLIPKMTSTCSNNKFFSATYTLFTIKWTLTWTRSITSIKCKLLKIPTSLSTSYTSSLLIIRNTYKCLFFPKLSTRTIINTNNTLFMITFMLITSYIKFLNNTTITTFMTLKFNSINIQKITSSLKSTTSSTKR